jgi:phosphoserine phosphatase RsbX
MHAQRRPRRLGAVFTRVVLWEDSTREQVGVLRFDIDLHPHAPGGEHDSRLSMSHGSPPRANTPVTPTAWSTPRADACVRGAHWITAPRIGESVSGDAVVARDEGGVVMFALVDALGHGPTASHVAQRAIASLNETSLGGGALGVIQRLHGDLRGTRGAGALVMLVHGPEVEVCSVGNVELRCARSRLPFVLTAGVLGVRLRVPRVMRTAYVGGDRFALFSDGISRRFDLAPNAAASSHAAVVDIFSKHRHAHDDATILVVDFT